MKFNMTWPTDLELSDYSRGYVQGLRAYAWWKDGQQYVGTCGTRLERAIEEFLTEQGYIKTPQAKP